MNVNNIDFDKEDEMVKQFKQWFEPDKLIGNQFNSVIENMNQDIVKEVQKPRKNEKWYHRFNKQKY